MHLPNKERKTYKITKNRSIGTKNMSKFNFYLLFIIERLVFARHTYYDTDMKQQLRQPQKVMFDILI